MMITLKQTYKLPTEKADNFSRHVPQLFASCEVLAAENNGEDQNQNCHDEG